MKPSLVFWLFGVLVGIVAFLFIGVAFDIIQVFGFIFLGYFCGIDPNSWMASLLVIFVFIFFRGLGLRMTYVISENRVLGRLSLFSISIVLLVPTRFIFHNDSMIFWISRINFPYSRG